MSVKVNKKINNDKSLSTGHVLNADTYNVKLNDAYGDEIDKVFKKALTKEEQNKFLLYSKKIAGK